MTRSDRDGDSEVERRSMAAVTEAGRVTIHGPARVPYPVLSLEGSLALSRRQAGPGPCYEGRFSHAAAAAVIILSQAEFLGYRAAVPKHRMNPMMRTCINGLVHTATEQATRRTTDEI